MADEHHSAPGSPQSSGGLLDLIEKVGNKLPDPATLFLIGTLIVMVLSAVAAGLEWEVVGKLPKPQFTEDGQQVFKDGKAVLVWEETGQEYRATSLLTRDGLFWAIDSMVDNFVKFPPLGVVLVGMLGIGVAERTGLIGALLKAFMLAVPSKLLTPSMVFIGIMSSMTLDAGYVVLPPLAALLYKAVGRSPLVGIAAVFAGVSAGFNANLFITGLDPMLAEFAQKGARVIDTEYEFNPACNWYFMIASTVVMTLVGWLVTSMFVERRLNGKSPDDGGPVDPSAEELADQAIKPHEARGMKIAGTTCAVVLGVFLALILVRGAPLYTFKIEDPDKVFDGGSIRKTDDAPMVVADVYEAKSELLNLYPPYAYFDADSGESFFFIERSDVVIESFEDGRAQVSIGGNEIVSGYVLTKAGGFERWVDAIVPMLFFVFIMPAIAYGMSVGTVRNDKSVAKLLIESMAAMGPIIVLAFFAAQFIEHFKYSGLDRMLAMAGGQALGKADMPVGLIIVAFILVTLAFNLFIGSMSAKYAMFAPIFIPMFMLIGISPELTQAAYRIGDSVSNIITPLNAYLVIILVFMQKYVPKGGMGTLISTMLPYTIVFTIVWSILLLLWMAFDIPLGPDGPLHYDPAAQEVIEQAAT